MTTGQIARYKTGQIKNSQQKTQFEVDRARQNHYHAHLFIP
jgi:hypothetical protein